MLDSVALTTMAKLSGWTTFAKIFGSMSPSQWSAKAAQPFSSFSPFLDEVHHHASQADQAFKWCVIVATILSATFLFSLDNTIVAEVQAVVVKDLGEANKLSWLGVAFVLASASTIVTWYEPVRPSRPLQ